LIQCSSPLVLSDSFVENIFGGSHPPRLQNLALTPCHASMHASLIATCVAWQRWPMKRDFNGSSRHRTTLHMHLSTLKRRCCILHDQAKRTGSSHSSVLASLCVSHTASPESMERALTEEARLLHYLVEASTALTHVGSWLNSTITAAFSMTGRCPGPTR